MEKYISNPHAITAHKILLEMEENSIEIYITTRPLFIEQLTHQITLQ